MITWVTVWVLTVHTALNSRSNSTYQLSYATQRTCLSQAKKHDRLRGGTYASCDFQQIPVYTGGKK